jgi:hypothetical protein
MTPKLMTPKLMTPKLMTPKLMTPKLMTPKLMTPKQPTPRSGTMARWLTTTTKATTMNKQVPPQKYGGRSLLELEQPFQGIQ